MDIKPLLETLASLDDACRDAVDCLNVLAYRSVGPEFGNLKKLQKLYGGDGNSGHRATIHQLIGVVGHCLNPEIGVRNYRMDIIKHSFYDGEDGQYYDTDMPYIDGAVPHEISATNAAAALLALVDQGKRSLLDAIARATGGNLEVVMAEIYGEPLIDNAWQRLSDNWDDVRVEVAIPTGLDLTDLRDSIRDEIKAAKHLLTFGSMISEIAATDETETPQARPTRKRFEQSQAERKPRKRDLCIPALLEHHGYGRDDELNSDAAVGNELARTLDISRSTVNAFFNENFASDEGAKDGFDNYKKACNDPVKLEHALKLLSGDVAPSILFQSLGSRAAELKADEPEDSGD